MYSRYFSVHNLICSRDYQRLFVVHQSELVHIITSDVYTLRFVFSVKHTRYDSAAMVELGVVGDHQHPRRARHDHPADVPQAYE